jgi:hypothetical protein
MLREREQEDRPGRLAAVVRVLRHEAEGGERPAPDLMDELAWFRIAPRVVGRRLRPRGDLDRATQHLGTEERSLPARRERVAAEEAGEHRDAGIGEPGAV